MSYAALLVYGTPLALIWGWYIGRRHRTERRHVRWLNADASAGLTEPASLHPVIDPITLYRLRRLRARPAPSNRSTTCWD